MDWSQCPYVDRDPERMGGVWCFKGVRLSVASLFDHLEHGVTVDEYLEWFPGVAPENVHGVLEFVRKSASERLAA